MRILTLFCPLFLLDTAADSMVIDVPIYVPMGFDAFALLAVWLLVLNGLVLLVLLLVLNGSNVEEEDKVEVLEEVVVKEFGWLPLM
jgi:hypothetical protein